MKVICSKPNLLNCVNTVQKAVSAKSTIQVLEGILVKAYDNTVTMMCNDLEISIECTINADTLEEGTIVVNSKFFGEIVRSLPDADVTIEANEENVQVTCEHAFFKLNAISPEGFPEPQYVDGEESFVMQAKDLRDNLRKAMIAVSQDENRPTLKGILFEIQDEKLTLVSIDGFRMAIRETSIKGYEGTKKIIVPGKTVSELSKIIEIEDEKVYVDFSENHIMFKTEEKKLVSKLLEGQFPNYISIIPRDDETKLTVKRWDLLEALERAAIVSTDEKRFPVVLTVENDLITITLLSDNASLKEEVDVNMTGEKVKIGFNPKFLIDALKVIEDDEVIVTFRGSVGPCIIKPMEGDSYLYLIVPVKIQSMR